MVVYGLEGGSNLKVAVGLIDIRDRLLELLPPPRSVASAHAVLSMPRPASLPALVHRAHLSRSSRTCGPASTVPVTTTAPNGTGVRPIPAVRFRGQIDPRIEVSIRRVPFLQRILCFPESRA